jgi:putative DNA primase/helicase
MSTFNDDDENISLSLSGYREKKKQKEDAVADGAEDVVDSEPEKINLKAVVTDLAKLDSLEYDQIRVEQAARIGVRPNTLDRAVKDLRAHKASPENKEKDRTDFLIDPIPWDHAVDGAGLLDAISDVAASHLILPLGAAETIALWSLLAHAHDCFNISPILAAISPTSECGKTTLLTLLTGLVPRPAVMFRAIEKWAPTLLIDEADTFLAGNEELRGILNAGHNRAYAYVLRAVGEDYEPKQFRVWAPKAIAKIGRLPPTLHSRAIQIKLQRKRIDENVVALRADRLGHLEPLRRQAARWIIDNSMSLKASEPEVPENLDGPCRR